VQLWDAEGKPVAIDGGRVVLEEYGTYACECVGEVELRFGERTLAKGSDGRFVLAVGPWAGALDLRIFRAGQLEKALHVEVQPRADKLHADAWAQLLEDLDAWLPGIAAGMQGGKHGTVAAAPRAVPGVAVGLVDLAPAVTAALRALLASPRQAERERWHDMPMHAVRRIDGATVRAAAGDPWVRHALGGGKALAEPRVSAFEVESSLDHPANRYAAWLVRRVIRRLCEIGEWLVAARPADDADVAAWCDARADAAAHARQTFERIFRSSFLARLPHEPPSVAALLTVQNDPAYGRLHRLCRPFLSPGFRPPAPDQAHTVPVRPSFGLYELWTFLALQRALHAALPSTTWKLVGANRLFSGNGTGAEYVAQLGSGTLRILFNPVFPGYLARGAARRYSLSKERRPDLVVTWEPTTGSASWVCLDAKYRVSPSALADAFSSAHIYRDSLRMEDHGGRCAAVWLLVPSSHPSTAPWFEQAFWEEHGCAAAECRPGASGAPVIAQLLNRLGICPSPHVA